MRIWTLIENTTNLTKLHAEHGLSLYLETETRRILFDTGQSGAFWDNAEAMGIDLQQVDFAILSHGHYDHGGGLRRFLEGNSNAPVYLNCHAFSPCFHGPERYIGLDPNLQSEPRLHFVDDVFPLGQTMELRTCNERKRHYKSQSGDLQILENGAYAPDPFLHEQYLLMEESGKRILFSGCSHKGICNLVHWFSPDVLIGGFHLSKLDPNGPEIQEIGQVLKESGTQFYTCHCTGSAQYEALSSMLGQRLTSLSTGMCVDL